MGEEEGISGRGRGRSWGEGQRRWWREPGPTAPSPAPSEAVRVGRPGVEAGAQLASSGNQRAGEGHRGRQWDRVSAGEYVCTLKGGGRRVREKEEGAGSTAALVGAYVRAGAGPGWGELKTKGLLRFPPARGCGGLREGAGSTEGRSPRNAPACAPSSPQQTASRQAVLADPAFPVLLGHDLPQGWGLPHLASPTPGPEQFPAKEFRFRTRQSAQNSTEAPEPRGHWIPGSVTPRVRPPPSRFTDHPRYSRSPGARRDTRAVPRLQGRSVASQSSLCCATKSSPGLNPS